MCMAVYMSLHHISAFMYMNVMLHVCICTMRIPGTQGDWKRASDYLELEFWVVVVLGIEPVSFLKATNVLNCRVISLVSAVCVFYYMFFQILIWSHRSRY